MARPPRWTAELGGPQQLIKQFGWSPTTVKAGMPSRSIGRVVKSGDPYMNLTERSQITMTDSGKEIYRTANFGQPAAAAQVSAARMLHGRHDWPHTSRPFFCSGVRDAAGVGMKLGSMQDRRLRRRTARAVS